MSLYYGVVTNRDMIKLRGERRPFWEFLDQHPDGWLTSLAYKAPTVLPESVNPMIWDCGAWTYKALDVPKLGKHLVTPTWVLERYSAVANPGAFVIAPDHMLLPDVGDHDARRLFNLESAREFLDPAREAGFRPMATVHGSTHDERVDMIRSFEDMGYDAVALGGLAGQASRRAVCEEAVNLCRQAVPGVWLHVLGLSSPRFAALWKQLNVQSFDGSSHFKQAFTGGAFFTSEGMKLTKHAAARTGEPITAPSCDCRACATLRDDGIDTRTYGSNETNMGRAAHNMNQLMKAQQCAMSSAVPGQLSWSLVSDVS